MGLFDFMFRKTQPASPPAQVPPTRALDWRYSEPHLLLLSQFLLAQRPEWLSQPYLEEALGEKPDVAISRFIAEGMLVQASLAGKLQTTFKPAELKPFLKERNLRVSGAKADLIERLIAADPDGMAAKVAHENILECSPEARAIAETHVGRMRADKDAAIAESLALLKAHNFAKASLSVSSYEAKQVHPRGVGIDWSNPDARENTNMLRTIFERRPKLLDGLADSEWEPLRIGAAMMHLWGSSRASQWLPQDFVGIEKFDNDTAARMILFNAQHATRIARDRKIGVKRFKILGSGDSCPACKRIAGKAFPIESIPDLPYEHCTCAMGCRCEALPMSGHNSP